ncbi:hypothetical protein I7V35_08515 [Pseudochrobactrum saccharolyticum]|nr:hypothetical protein [Pseudochrobactrum saccharolyticum]
MKPMKKIAIASAVTAFGLLGISAQNASADNVEWGCQVLMCAASSAPSWQGVPYCVPPMTKLIAAMKLPGFSWPICPDSNTGKPAYEPYEPCPSGFAAQTIGEKHDTSELCVRFVNKRPNPNEYPEASVTPEYGGSDDQYIRGYIISQSRKRKENPYYYDIPNEQGVKQRFYFNLRF